MRGGFSGGFGAVGGVDKLNTKNKMSKSQLTFAVFVLNKYALATKQPITEVYKHFDKLHILDDYILKHYDVLHTLGENYLLEDLTELVTQKSLQK